MPFRPIFLQSQHDRSTEDLFSGLVLGMNVVGFHMGDSTCTLPSRAPMSEVKFWLEACVSASSLKGRTHDASKSIENFYLPNPCDLRAEIAAERGLGYHVTYLNKL